MLLDAAGTLLHPAEPVAGVYARHAGVTREFVATRLRAAMSELRPLRAGDPGWRAYWRAVVARSTSTDDVAVFEALYAWFARPEAWRVAPGAEALATSLRRRGVKVAILSNWDDRLRRLLGALGVLSWVDLAVVSAEEGIEKPAPAFFALACRRLGVSASRALMVGDTPSADVDGARAAGCAALHYGTDIADFSELARHLVPA